MQLRFINLPTRNNKKFCCNFYFYFCFCFVVSLFCFLLLQIINNLFKFAFRLNLRQESSLIVIFLLTLIKINNLNLIRIYWLDVSIGRCRNLIRSDGK